MTTMFSSGDQSAQPMLCVDRFLHSVPDIPSDGQALYFLGDSAQPGWRQIRIRKEGKINYSGDTKKGVWAVWCVYVCVWSPLKWRLRELSFIHIAERFASAAAGSDEDDSSWVVDYATGPTK